MVSFLCSINMHNYVCHGFIIFHGELFVFNQQKQLVQLIVLWFVIVIEFQYLLFEGANM